MHFLVYIILFLIFSFVGFILDSIYCSITTKRFVKSGYVPYLPLCPLYGFGGLLLFALQRGFGYLPWYVLHLLGVSVVVLAEYVGGVYCVKILKERLWDYRSEIGNIGGHISLLHSTYWFFIVLLFIKLIFPIVSSLENYLFGVINLSDTQEIIIFAIFLLLYVTLSYIEFLRRLRKKSASKK